VPQVVEVVLGDVDPEWDDLFAHGRHATSRLGRIRS
jgi:hypothetical protein